MRDDEERQSPGPVDQVVDEVEKAFVGPMQVLEDEHERALLAERLEEAPPRREGLAGMVLAQLLVRSSPTSGAEAGRPSRVARRR